MAKMRIEGMIGAMEGIVEGLKKARSESGPKIEKIVSEWAQRVEKDARVELKRPLWKLSSNIDSKVKSYESKKIWAMAGFKFQEKGNKRDPGYYGQFHEAGWAPTGHKVTVPDHFLRKAKQKNQPWLKTEVERVLPDIMERVRQELVKAKANKE